MKDVAVINVLVHSHKLFTSVQSAKWQQATEHPLLRSAPSGPHVNQLLKVSSPAEVPFTGNH